MSRGERRRSQLVEAGVDLLAEQGWSAITTRAVAERAGANLGLIHYHFGGLPALRLAIADRAVEVVIGPVLGELMAATDERAALDALRRLLQATAGDSRAMRLAMELLTEGFRDPAFAERSRDQLRQARVEIAVRLGQLRADWSPERKTGAAILITALLDGLMLHRLVDPGLDTEPALAALEDLLGVGR